MSEFTFKGVPVKLVVAADPGTCDGCIVEDYFGETTEGLCNFCSSANIFVKDEE